MYTYPDHIIKILIKIWKAGKKRERLTWQSLKVTISWSRTSPAVTGRLVAHLGFQFPSIFFYTFSISSLMYIVRHLSKNESHFFIWIPFRDHTATFSLVRLSFPSQYLTVNGFIIDHWYGLLFAKSHKSAESLKYWKISASLLFYFLETIIINRWMTRLCKCSRLFYRLPFFPFFKSVHHFFSLHNECRI